MDHGKVYQRVTWGLSALICISCTNDSARAGWLGNSCFTNQVLYRKSRLALNCITQQLCERSKTGLKKTSRN